MNVRSGHVRGSWSANAYEACLFPLLYDNVIIVLKRVSMFCDKTKALSE